VPEVSVPLEAVIVVVPAATPEAIPLVARIVAVAVVLELHVAGVPSAAVVPSLRARRR